MKGYIYRLYAGSDPADGWVFNDPIFGSPPTLGACVPNVRENVQVGDWVFCISGRTKAYQPFVVGGFRVDEKIDALQAYGRFPQYRLVQNERQVTGNIIVNERGEHHPLDDHSGFDRRIKNYLVGGESVQLRQAPEIEKGRNETVSVLSRIFRKPANRSFDVVPRWRRMDSGQVNEMKDWLRSLTQ